MSAYSPGNKSIGAYFLSFAMMALGAFLAALSIQVFLFPNGLIDGGIVGLSMICAKLLGPKWISLFLVGLNLPFIYLASKYIRKTFVIYMAIAILLFAACLIVLKSFNNLCYQSNDSLIVIVIGGVFLGVGAGLIIRSGGCTDGTEILGIILNKKKGFTVGQVVLSINVLIFAAYGQIFGCWDNAIKSLLLYVVAFKMMDLVILGLEEMKSVMIISSVPDEIRNVVMNELGLGLTVMYGRGGYDRQTPESASSAHFRDVRDILYVIVERLDLADLKDIILQTDPQAFITIQNVHEVVHGQGKNHLKLKKPKR